MDQERLRMESADLYAKNIEKIAELFPNCITETRGEDGNLKLAVDFDKLRQNLEDAGELAQGREAYDFTWVGKRAAMAEAYKPIKKTLRPCVEESVDWDNTQNLYIEGDNLEVLKLLQESYLNKVKLIYIDPPYNTGSDLFVYPDNYRSDDKKYDLIAGTYDEQGNKVFEENNDTNPRFHSDWCSMIYSRLLLARNLLTDDGFICISIDYNENYNLRKIVDEVFGASNFVGEIYWESKTKSQNTTTAYNKLQPKVEMILVYSKQGARRFNLIVKEKKSYPLTDEKGLYREYPLEVMNALGQRGRETMIYDITDGVSTVSPPAGKQWQLGQAQVATYQKSGNLFIRDGKVIIKMRPEFERSEKTEPFWGFFSKDLGTAESAKKELTNILPKHSFETVKPIEIIKRLIYHCTNKNDIILDFFSGSATTAHATMQLNAETDGKRSFILVQYQEKYDSKSEAFNAGFLTICDMAKERIRRAGKKIQEESGVKDLDVGFRVLKVDDTNMKPVYYDAGQTGQESPKETVSNIKEGRTGIDVLFGCLLSWGLPLTCSYKEETIEGFKFLNYADGALMFCFDEGVTEEAMRAVAKKRPIRVVLPDSCFTASKSKSNFTTIFKRESPETRIKTL